MKHTAKRMEVIITTEDKGSAVVVLDIENYIKEANSQLFDKINYKTLQTDRALQHDKLGNDTLDQFKNKKILSKTTAEELKVINPKTSKFYITPKIHKKNYPGWPIINSINCRISKTLRFVDHQLQLLVNKIPLYIKGTFYNQNK